LKKKNPLKIFTINIFFIIACFFALLPILYAFSLSLNANSSILSSDFSFIPKVLSLKNYKAVFVEKPVIMWFLNTFSLAFFTVILSLSVSIPAAYMFSEFSFKGKKPIIRILILLYSFPSILSMFAIYKLLSNLNLINTRIGLVIVYTGTMAIFGLINMKGYFDTIPNEIEDAARLDGASDFMVVRKIIIPLARPSIIVTGIQVLIYVWNEYIFAINFMTGSDKFTLASGLYTMQATEKSGSWAVFSAASIVISIPILTIFFLSQKYMISGLTSGGVKG